MDASPSWEGPCPAALCRPVSESPASCLSREEAHFPQGGGQSLVRVVKGGGAQSHVCPLLPPVPAWSSKTFGTSSEAGPPCCPRHPVSCCSLCSSSFQKRADVCCTLCLLHCLYSLEFSLLFLESVGRELRHGCFLIIAALQITPKLNDLKERKSFFFGTKD